MIPVYLIHDHKSACLMYLYLHDPIVKYVQILSISIEKLGIL